MRKIITDFIILILIILFIYFGKIYIDIKFENFEGDIQSKVFENKYGKDVQIVVCRYKESLDFLKLGIFDNYKVIIYNKGDEIVDPDITSKYEIIPLENVGKIDHTVLYHIITNYHNLHDSTFFLPASYFNHNDKRYVVDVIMDKLNDSPDVYTAINFNDWQTKNSVLEDLYDFKIDSWVTSDNNNKNPDVDNSMLPCPIRPFGEWYKKMFGEKKVKKVFYYGIFTIGKGDITKNPVEKYRELISYIDSHPNPEAGHYIERSWTTLFEIE